MSQVPFLKPIDEELEALQIAENMGSKRRSIITSCM